MKFLVAVFLIIFAVSLLFLPGEVSVEEIVFGLTLFCVFLAVLSHFSFLSNCKKFHLICGEMFFLTAGGYGILVLAGDKFFGLLCLCAFFALGTLAFARASFLKTA